MDRLIIDTRGLSTATQLVDLVNYASAHKLVVSIDPEADEPYALYSRKWDAKQSCYELEAYGSNPHIAIGAAVASNVDCCRAIDPYVHQHYHISDASANGQVPIPVGEL